MGGSGRRTRPVAVAACQVDVALYLGDPPATVDLDDLDVLAVAAVGGLDPKPGARWPVQGPDCGPAVHGAGERLGVGRGGGGDLLGGGGAVALGLGPVERGHLLTSGGGEQFAGRRQVVALQRGDVGVDHRPGRGASGLVGLAALRAGGQGEQATGEYQE